MIIAVSNQVGISVGHDLTRISGQDEGYAIHDSCTYTNQMEIMLLSQKAGPTSSTSGF
jgi:hypothetical protein